jgi:hypothetical protein
MAIRYRIRCSIATIIEVLAIDWKGSELHSLLWMGNKSVVILPYYVGYYSSPGRLGECKVTFHNGGKQQDRDSDRKVGSMYPKFTKSCEEARNSKS